MVSAAFPQSGRSDMIFSAGRPSVTTRRTVPSSPSAPISLPAHHSTVSPSLHLGHWRRMEGARSKTSHAPARSRGRGGTFEISYLLSRQSVRGIGDRALQKCTPPVRRFSSARRLSAGASCAVEKELELARANVGGTAQAHVR